jgi:monoterpene epsilon-lactone hydrolase
MSREYDALLAALTAPMFPAGDPLELAREKLNAVHGHALADDVRVAWTELGGVRCAWVDTPESEGSERVLLLCHGGGYIAAGGDGYLFYAEMLSRPCAARVLLVDYRLAPEHRFPAALDDCVNAYRGLLDSGVAPGRVGLIGDSCGGALTIASLVRLRAQGVALPALAVALGGWFDLEADGESARDPAGFDPFAQREFIRERGRDYLGEGGDVREPLASPLHADLTGLPPLLLQVGQVDLTRDDALRLAARAGRVGVDVTLEIHPGMIHGFQGLANAGIPEAGAALARVADYLAARMPDASAGNRIGDS